jgi:hypothetical protein
LASPHKVRLGDGSVIDLELPELKSWYESGLVTDETQVQRPHARDWTRLADATDVRGWKRPGAPRGVSVPAGRGTGRPSAPAAGRPSAKAPFAPRPDSTPAASAAARIEWGRWVRLAAFVFVPLLLLYLAGPILLPLVIGTAEERRVKSAAMSDRRFAGVGVTLDAPTRWSILRPDHGLFEAPAGTRVALAQPAANAFAILASESPARAYPSLDAYLDRVFAARRATEGGLREVRREDAPGGARRLVAARVSNRTAIEEVITAWRAGWTYYALAVWAPEAGGRAAAGAEEIRKGIAVDTRLAERLANAVAAVTAEVPLLTPETAERLMGQSEAQVLEPADAFRRTYALAGRGIPILPPAEQREIGALSSELYARLPAADRARLGGYIDRVRDRRATEPAEDLAMSALVKGAFARLPAARQKRLRALFDKAIGAALDAEARA